MNRVDLFTVIHKGLRSLLFDLSRDAARVDLTSTQAVDGLVAQVEQTLGFLEEHARLEDNQVIVAVRALDPDLADELAADHRSLDVVQLEVERAADALALAQLSARVEAGKHLARVINHLVAVHLIHMNREETEVNATLWAGLSDNELIALKARAQEMLTPDRRVAWMQLIAPALNPVEQRLVIGA